METKKQDKRLEKRFEVKQDNKKDEEPIKIYDSVIEYIEKEKLIGTPVTEIKKKLIQKGWQEKVVEVHIKEVYKPEKKEKYPYHELIIPRKEQVSGVYHAGRYKLLTTVNKLIVLKKSPKALKEISYKDIELIDYHTTIKWRSLFLFLLFGFLIGIMAIKLDSLSQVITSIFTGDIDPIKMELAIIAFTVLGFFALMYLVLFFTSMFGKLRILPRDGGPVEITTNLTDDVKAVIKDVGEAREKFCNPELL
jgi:hypothetical protein